MLEPDGLVAQRVTAASGPGCGVGERLGGDEERGEHEAGDQAGRGPDGAGRAGGTTGVRSAEHAAGLLGEVLDAVARPSWQTIPGVPRSVPGTATSQQRSGTVSE
jgi:hypothetical protein